MNPNVLAVKLGLVEFPPALSGRLAPPQQSTETLIPAGRLVKRDQTVASFVVQLVNQVQGIAYMFGAARNSVL